ncbi:MULTISPECIES: glycosyltransferase [unclassified Nocardiopsis]|uniref:glycosyltransferase n=1 Tax=unclassified Nocardiopsis TaxID=2649073 RepID=UPI001357D886|nr:MULTISPECIES: glycosyltransferase [unclassified Nocardiopsis]
MITSVLRQALRTRGREPAMLCHTGFRPGGCEHLARLRLRDGDGLVDLDARPMGRAVGAGGAPEGGGAVGLLAVVAASLTDLRRCLTLAPHLPSAVHLVVAVPDSPGHQGPLLPAPPGGDEWHGLHELRVRRAGRRGWVCELFFPDATDTAVALHQLLRGTGGPRRGPAAVPLAGLHGPEGALWRSGDVSAPGLSATGPVPLRRVTPVADLAVRTHDGTPLPGWEDDAVPCLDVATTSAESWEGRGRAAADSAAGPGTGPVTAPDAGSGAAAVPGGGLPPGPGRAVITDLVAPVDERVVNPCGFTRGADGPMGDLTVHGGQAVLRDGDTVLATLPSDGTVTDLDVARARYLRGVRVDWSGHSGPAAAVRAVASLAAAGVPLVSGPVPAWTAALGRPLADLLTGVGEEALRDPLVREEHSVRLRRAALRDHGLLTRWRLLGGLGGVPLPPEPRVSVLLCTRRPEMVGFALAQIARQRHVRMEVVLTLHGFPADLPEVRSAVAAFTAAPVTVHEAPADQVFGSVLNDAVDRASGQTVAKWDDDDWYGPEHLADLVLARTYSGADLTGCSPDYVYLGELDATVWRDYRSEIPWPHVAGGTMLTDRSVLEETGGFRPLPRAVDSQLLLAVRRGGGRVYRTHGLGYVLRRAGEGHTWAEETDYFLRRSAGQWSGWRPSALMEGEPAPLGRTDGVSEYTGGHR